MSSDLKQLSLVPVMEERLPLGYHRILVSEAILDEETTKRLALEYSRYRHVSTFVPRPRKQISKVEL
jgi:hypothetical protein